MDSDWLKGPHFLQNINTPPLEQEEILLGAHDPEVRKESLTCATLTEECQSLGTERFTRFSSLASLQRAIASQPYCSSKGSQMPQRAGEATITCNGKQTPEPYCEGVRSSYLGNHMSSTRRGLWGGAQIGAP